MSALMGFVLTGCFHYRSVDPAQVTSGAMVVAHLITPTEFHSGGISFPRVVSVEGSVVRIEDERVLLVVETLHVADASRHRVVRTPFWVGPNDLIDFEERQLDRRASFLAGGGLVLAGGLVAASLFRRDLRDGGGRQPPTEPVANVLGITLCWLGNLFR